MSDVKGKFDIKKVDTKEFELPETTFVRDIDNRVFQSIILQCLAGIEGISLVEGNLFDHILGRSALEGIKGIYAEQDQKNHCVNIRAEVNICYGIVIPDKAEEIQTKITEEITKLTGLHVACVHVVFKNVINPEQMKKLGGPAAASSPKNASNEEYTDEF